MRRYLLQAGRGARALGLLLRDVGLRIGAARVSDAAATMSYYALFSLFPLLLILVAVGGYLLERGQAYDLVVAIAGTVFPASRSLIESTIERVIQLRGPVGLLGGLTLLWSASGFFSSLTYNVERAWPLASTRSVVQRRLVALAMVVTLALLMIASILANAFLEVLPSDPLIGRASAFGMPLWEGISNLMPWLLTFLMYLSLYRWLPNTRVTWRGAAWGAGVATVLWQGAGSAFLWYLESGLVHYELVYGSLGALVVLMLWIYIGSWLTLAGAHLSAAISQYGEGSGNRSN
jgi:membrane protein